MRRRNRQAGQALYLTAASLVVLMGFLGLGIDMGMLRYQKRIQQTAADAAAIAGAEEIPYSSSGIPSAAQQAAADNGFSGATNTGCPPPAITSIGTITVTVNNPPCSGPHVGDSNYVEAYVSELQPTYFMKIFGVNSETVTARAVATMVSDTGGSPGCIYTLGPVGTGFGVKNSGTPTVDATSCDIFDNGNWTTNGAPVNIQAAGIGVVGSSTNNGGGTVNPTPTNIPPFTDPLSWLPPPCSGSACTGGPSIQITNGGCGSTCSANVSCSGGLCSVAPGTYGSISIQGSTVDFGAGTYVVDGNFTVNGNSTICDSSNADCSGMTSQPIATNGGVTFYITGSSSSVNIDGTTSTYLAAPTTGTYAGILFYQDPNDTSAATLSGTSNSFYEGALYFPTAQLNFGGTMSNTTAAYTVIVSFDLKIFGTSDISIKSDYSSLPGGVFPSKNAVLVE